MNIVAAIVAGVVGTAVLSVLLEMAPRMGMPEMPIPRLLGGMLPGGLAAGWVMHFIIGAVWAIIFAILWNAGIGTAGWLWGLIFGVGAFIVAGLVMPALMNMHPDVQAGDMPNPGLFMSNAGMMGTVGGLIGHVIFGLVVGLVYVAFF